MPVDVTDPRSEGLVVPVQHLGREGWRFVGPGGLEGPVHLAVGEDDNIGAMVEAMHDMAKWRATRG